MSMYRNAIAGVTLTRVNIGAISKVSELDAYNAKLQATIKAVVNSFPVSFTALQAANLLTSARNYGQIRLAELRGGFGELILSVIGRPVNITGLQMAINAVDDADKKWRSKIPYVGAGYVYTKDKNKEWDEVNKLVMRVYIEVGGLIGERAAMNEAKAELAHNLNPVAPMNLLKIVAIVAVVSGATMAIPKVIEQINKHK